MEEGRHISTKCLDKIDLTGDEPIITKEIVKEVVPLVNIDEDENNERNIENQKNINDKKKKICEICLDEISKYTCPGCQVKTCSLECVKKHKSLTSCTGERNKAGFVSKTQFTNLNLLSDYRFLEEANRIADNAKRDPYTKRIDKMSRKDSLVRGAALKRKINMKFMSKGMKRSKENSTYYIIKKDELLWQVKLIFEDIKEEILHRFSETTTIDEMLKQYIDPAAVASSSKLKFACYMNRNQNETIDVYYRNENFSEHLHGAYLKCDKHETLRKILENKTVIEFPVFHVALPESSKKFDQVSDKMKFDSGWKTTQSFYETSNLSQNHDYSSLTNHSSVT